MGRACTQAAAEGAAKLDAPGPADRTRLAGVLGASRRDVGVARQLKDAHRRGVSPRGHGR
jgi:hypothetical protein